MLDALREKKIGVRILLGLVVGVLGIGMLLYLVPQGDTGLTGANVVAQVGDQSITVNDVQDQLTRLQARGNISPTLMGLYAQQVLQQLIYQKALILEADQLGLGVTDAEHAERIRELVPTAYAGGSFVGMDRYSSDVQTRFQMDVPSFESAVKQDLLESKFVQMVTDGITVSDSELQEQFKINNEKIKIDYSVIKPDDLQAKINPSDADLASYFEKNKAKYVVPERRTLDYAVLDVNDLRNKVQVSEDDEKVYYQAHIDQYKLQDRANVSHILFKTVGQTDAEVAETKKKAEDVLSKVKHGGNFADLAKQYSDDTTKDKGGDLGWIVRGQTVPEFEAVAFSLPKGSISDLVKTQYGFHIIKVNDREMARTQTFEEVKPAIEMALRQDKAEQTADTEAPQIAEDIRRNGRMAIADLAKKYNLTAGEAKQVEVGQPLFELGNAPGLLDGVFRQRVGDLSAPIHTDKGYVVISVKDIEPSHPATLAEVHDRVLNDYRQENAVVLAKARADEFAKRVKMGENFAMVAKSLGFDVKTSDPFARTGSVPDAGNAQLFSAAFSLPVGQSGNPVQAGANWIVYRVAAHDPLNQDDFAKQKDALQTQVLQAKKQAAYDLFRTSLEDRLKQQGKLRINEDNMKQFTSPT